MTIFVTTSLMALAAALLLAWYDGETAARRRLLIGAVVFIYVGGWIGARLSLIPRSWDLFAKYPVQFLLMPGGWDWYGGLAGGAVAVWLWARWQGVTFLSLVDAMAPIGALGQAIGRLGCQLAGDGDYGIPTTMPWGMSYPDGAVPTTATVHPTPIYEMATLLAIFAYLWVRRRQPRADGDQFGRYLVLAGAGRFLVEFVRRNPVWVAGLTAFQWCALASIAIGTVLVLRAAPTGAAAAAPGRGVRGQQAGGGADARPSRAAL
jgi:phosphatidylglycerol:prolipoprotein diacylglycerol transferase